MGAEDDGGGGRRLGRYVLYEPIASGGMASVHFGRMLGPIGFARTVAIKRLHPHLAHDPEFVAMFLDEARLAARVQHPNVVSTLDIVAVAGEVFLVMDYIKGESLAGLLRSARARAEPLPPPVLVSIVVGALHGLDAAHEAKSDRGEALSVVHRDVSPQNILVGEDGVARIADFGVAKAAWRVQSTREGQLKGKLSYMSPEQARQLPLDRRTDLYATGVVLWEGLAGRRLFPGDDPAGILAAILTAPIQPPSHHAPGVGRNLDQVVLRALARNPEQRFATALEMASALERALAPASQGAVGHWVRANAEELLSRRAARLAAIEASPEGADPLTAPNVPVSAGTASAIRRLSNAPTRPEIVLPVTPLASLPPEEPRSQLSSVSVAQNVKPAHPERRLAVFGIGAALLIAGIVIGGRLPSWSSRTPAALPAQDPPALGSAAASTPPPPSAPLAAAGEAASSAPSATPHNAEAGAKDAGSSRPVRHPTSAPGRRDCDPPYTLDPSSRSPDGQPLKRFKPWCL
jgi:serine/threonine protein kinase